MFLRYDEIVPLDFNEFLTSDKIDYPKDERLIEYFKNDDVLSDIDINTWMTTFIWKRYSLDEKDFFFLTLATLIGDLLPTGWILYSKLKEFKYSIDEFERWFKLNVTNLRFKGKHRHFTPYILSEGLKLWNDIEKKGGIDGLFQYWNYNFTNTACYLEQIKYVGRYSSVIFVQTLNEIASRKITLDDFFHNSATPFARAFIYLFKLKNVPDYEFKKMKHIWIPHKKKLNKILFDISDELNCDYFIAESRMCDWYYFWKNSQIPYVGSHIQEIQDIIDKTKISQEFDWSWYGAYLDENKISHRYKELRWEKTEKISLEDKISLINF